MPLYKDGHYYSPIPDIDDLRKRASYIFDTNKKTVADVDLQQLRQVNRLDEMKQFGSKFDKLLSSESSRYSQNNNFFIYSDAFYLFAMMSLFDPKRIIEVGSGFSSALMLDIREEYELKDLDLVFIEPNPRRLLSQLRDSDARKQIIQKKVQEVDVNIFTNLSANDFLFIDSSHVSKVGSDVNFILFDVLPMLKPDTIIHFHDIIWPFEYPKEWVYEGRYWNEAYLLRAFLMNNNDYEILLFNSYLAYNHQDWLQKHLPECTMPGGSLYIKKLR